MKITKNDITGKLIRSSSNSKDYQQNYEKVFNKNRTVECGNCNIKSMIHSKNQKCRY